MFLRISLCAFAIASGAYSAEWSQFRGPDGNGVAEEKGLPTSWSPKENVKWKTDLPGRSAASPVVYGKKIYVTSASGPRMDRLHVICLDADSGKILWQRQLTATGNTACHPKSSMAAPTPCVNADGVFCLFATADLAAFDHEGNLKWYRSLVGDYPYISNQVGMAASPILWKDFLIVPMDTVGESFIAAVDTKYGKNVWKVERPKEINWVTPTLRNTGDGAEVIFSAGKETTAYNAADGRKNWTIVAAGASVPTALTVGDQVLLPLGAGVTCLKPDGKKMAEVWKAPKLSSGYTTPLVYKDRVYAINRVGVLNCADLKTGTEVWNERIVAGKGAFWASPIACDDKIFTFDDGGICTVIQAGGDKAKVLSVNDLKAEILGTPAIAHRSLFIQTATGIYCIAAKK
jgi:outer membrane protein assembly factor BamB